MSREITVNIDLQTQWNKKYKKNVQSIYFSYFLHLDNFTRKKEAGKMMREKKSTTTTGQLIRPLSNKKKKISNDLDAHHHKLLEKKYAIRKSKKAFPIIFLLCIRWLSLFFKLTSSKTLSFPILKKNFMSITF